MAAERGLAVSHERGTPGAARDRRAECLAHLPPRNNRAAFYGGLLGGGFKSQFCKGKQYSKVNFQVKTAP